MFNISPTVVAITLPLRTNVFVFKLICDSNILNYNCYRRRYLFCYINYGRVKSDDSVNTDGTQHWYQNLPYLIEVSRFLVR